MPRQKPVFSCLLIIAAAGMLACSTGRLPAADPPQEEPVVEPEAAFPPSHEQKAIIEIPLGDQPAAIHTFCLDTDGNLLAACGGERMTSVRGENGYETKMVQEPSGIRVISPAGKLLATWSLEMTPQAVNLGPDGLIYVAGQGRVAQLDPQGNVLKMVDSPQLTELPPPAPAPEAPAEDEDDDDEAAKKAKQEKVAELRKQQQTLMPGVREAYAAVKSAEEDGPAAVQTASEEFTRLMAEYTELREQIEILTTSPQVLAARQRAAWMRKRAVNSIAVSQQDVFVACPSTQGFGYDVWRMDLDLNQPQKIVTRLSGCCGQMDIQASDGKLYVAENSRKRVVCYDREGERLCAWGKSDRKGVIGFGSCCNPMNLRFGPDGSVYTSESSLGRIKRFTPEGEFLGLVGTAEVVPGCKHVAVGVSPDSDRVYLLDITRKQIVVLGRIAEAGPGAQ